MLATTARELASAVAGQLIVGNPDILTTSVAIDSRDVVPGSTFIALAGERADGHRFALQAAENGATVLLVSDVSIAAELRVSIDVDKVAVVLVEDGLSAAQSLAIYQRSLLDVLVVGVTGSTGKTSVKSFVESVLAQRFVVTATEGNQNNELGCPLTILRADDQTDVLVIEMGMRAPGEIAELAAISRPHIGIVTNIGPVHLETLGSLDAIVDAKGELLRALPADGLAVIEAGTPHSARLGACSTAPIVSVGLASTSAKPDVYGTVVSISDDGCVHAMVHAGDGSFSPFSVDIPVPGVHHLTNALFAVGVGLHLGLSPDEIARGIKGAVIPGMRWLATDITSRGITIINDAYNANPTSVAGAVRTFVTVSPHRRHIAILGDMLELGVYADDEHRRIGEVCAAAGVDIVFGFGLAARAIVEAAAHAGIVDCRHFEAREIEIMLRAIEETLTPGDVVLVKGSRGMALERVVDYLAADGPISLAMGAEDVR